MQVVNNKPKVLYVDDEEENLLVFRSSFRRYYDVMISSSAKQAIELLQDNPVDVIISDQRMPEISGVEFLNDLPDKGDNIRMILSGFSDIEAVVGALNSGKVYKYISKPWEKDELLKIIDDAIDNLHSRKLLIQQQLPGDHNTLTNPSLSKVTPEDGEGDVENLKKQVNEAYENVQLLSEIGQEVTSTLNLDAILNTVYENVNRLMDATVFGIGIYNSDNNTIDYQLAIEKGKRYKPYSRTMEDKNQFPVWCIENKKEIFINDVYSEYSRYINQYKDQDKEAILEDGTKFTDPLSFIYMPLMIKGRIIGLTTVQSFNKNAYTQFHLNSLRNIGIFVATALENAKAYALIEEQKTEIEQKNIELEQKVEQRTEELRLQKDELEDTFGKLKLLTEIGQEITSSLDLNKILNTVYENVNQLMDASVFGIGIYHPETEIIDIRLAIENGKRYQPYQRNMEDKNEFSVWCIENKKEIYINNIEKEYSRYIKKFDHKVVVLEDGSQSAVPLSLIYMPLLFNNEPTGILTIQSFRKHAYNQYHLDILRSIASYITTAIQNAHSYSKMTEAFEQLKSAQSKLVESEKMASLGVLTAGVAHEINNPVNFISGGIQSLQENYNEIEILLKDLLAYHENQSNELWEKISVRKAELALDKLLPEVEDLFMSIRNGAKRTTDIVKGLRNFSRLDETDMKKAKLEEGIDNTIILLNNKFKNKIDILKEYGDTPEIMCFPGQLNQVFMNILYNAADAISLHGEIKVKTWVETDTLKISIKDNGSGMPEEVRSRIFEPFYTTKEVGKGTGLGLSISYGIIEKHKGTIEVKSIERKGLSIQEQAGLSAGALAEAGTEFIITLPITK